MPNPLIRSELARLWVGVGVAALAGLGGLFIAAMAVRSWWSGPFTVDRWLVLAAIQVIAAPVAGWAIVADERPSRLSATVDFTGIGITALVLVVAGGLALHAGLQALDAQPGIGTPSREVAVPFALAGAAFLMLALLIAAVRWPPRGRRAAAALGAGALALTVGVGTAGAVVSTRSSCEAFRFSAERWDRMRHDVPAGETMARAVARCHVLRGQRRAVVLERLGRPAERRAARARWLSWGVADVAPTGFFDEGEESYLTVRFDRQGRADRVRFVVVDHAPD